MAQLIDIRKVTISPRSLTAEVRFSADAPLFTADDLEGTDRIIDLMPQMLDHTCYGDGGETFGAVVDDTEIAHLLEHVTVEVLVRTKRAGAISAGQTRELDARRRAWELRFACPDDVLVAGALSSAAWIVEWAYTGGGDPEPDLDAIAKGLVALVDGIGAEDAASDDDEFDADATVAAAPLLLEDATAEIAAIEVEAVPEPLAANAPEPEPVPEPEQEPVAESESVPEAEAVPAEEPQGELTLPRFEI